MDPVRGRLEGEKRIPLSAIAAVQWKPATWLVRGFIQFTMAGGVEVKSRFRHQTADASHDENSVVFNVWQMGAFAELRAAVEAALGRTQGAAIAPPAAPTGGTGSDPAGRLRGLSELHAAGLISDAEFAAKRAEILGQI